jgi:hypothetical protein
MSIEEIGYMSTMEPEAFRASGPNVLLAFAKALNAVEDIAKTQTADTGKFVYRFADLGAVFDEVKRACQMFDLSVFQVPSHDGDKLAVTTVLLHDSGEWLEFSPLGMRLPNDAQAVGSALTYSRRYALLTLFGVCPEDDDGRAATQAARAPEQNQGYRSPAEQMVYAEIAMLDTDTRKRLVDDFKRSMGSGMSDLPPNKHGDALTFVRGWLDQEQERLEAARLSAGIKEDAKDEASRAGYDH